MGRGRMDFFQHRYYRTTKNVMLASLQWPYITPRVRCGLFALELLFSTGQVMMMTMSFLRHHEDRDILLQSVMISSITIFCVTKHITTRCNSDKMLKLLNYIRADWFVWAGEQEVNILHEYAEQGRNYVIVYTVAIYSAIVVYAVQPIVRKIIDILLNNGSKPEKFLYSVYYYNLDAQKYYIYLMIYTYASISALSTIHVTNDVMMIVYIQHGCGVFAALGHKLQRIGKNEKSAATGKSAYDSKQMNRTFEYMIHSCIERHNDVLEYSNLITTYYSWLSVVMMIYRILFVNLIGFQIFKGMNEPHEMVKFGTYAVCSVSYVYIESLLGQVLMDHSISIQDHIQNSHWYILSPSAQKLLLMMTTRCNVPCGLKVGYLFTISVESFVVFLKASVSYLTFLRSL